MTYDNRYPGIADLKIKAKKRIPNFAFDYIDAAIDEEYGKQRNRDAFHSVQMTPRYLCNVETTNLITTLFGKPYDMPVGVPPVGLGNMMWPGSEIALAKAAQSANIPYILSTFSTTSLEEIAHSAPDVCWFQLYVPQDESVMEDMIKRVSNAGYHALVITVDIPVGAKRNRELKNGLKLPFSITPSLLWQALLHPQWSIATLKNGIPDFVNVQRYNNNPDQPLNSFFTNFCIKGVDKKRIKKIRKLWHGPLILKGIQDPQDAEQAIELGIDGIVISNHGGRQLDAAPSSMASLQLMPDKIFKHLTVMLDSGIRTGMDVARAKAYGAKMSFSGRSFFYGVGALGCPGAKQVIEIYRDEITRTIQQLGCPNFDELNQSWLAR